MLPILLIDDNYQQLRTSTYALQMAGYDVCPAAAYHAALDMFRLYGRFSICISDIEIGTYDPMLLMKEMHHLRERYDTPILLTSERMAEYATVCDVLRLPTLAKPFTHEALLQRIQHLMIQDMAS
jgi:DNA-binding response OmpR family regulator